jgi:serine/threonine protein kinase
MKKCPKCKSENPDNATFCADCGTQLPSIKDIEVTETMETPKEELTTGSTFAGRYQIIEELGKGGMGKVYKAYDTKIKEKIALKLIKPEIAKDKKTIERFSNELRFARKIRHKNVCGMFDLGEEKGTHYITMEFVPGEDLRSSIRRFGQLPIGKSISIATQICEGLTEAHRLGVVHRDLKSNNIMIDKDGNVRIMDFGIARSLEAKGITGSGVMIGTPEYMSPEQVEGKEVDQRSDIYSLGVILYEMVTGRVPFEGNTPFTIGMKHKGEIPQNPKELNAQIPDDLNRVILRCLEKDREKRYQNVGEVHSELVNIEKGIPTTERVVPKRKPLTSKEITVTFGLRKLLLPFLIFIGIAIIGVVIWMLLPKKRVVPLDLSKPSIAVLPFEDLSPQKDQEFFCDGFAESLINALTKIKDLRVPARASSFSFKEAERNISEIGNELNVSSVLEGSVQKAGNKIRITVQLINVHDSSLVWSEQYDRNIEDVFSIQDEITLEIVKKLKLDLIGEEKKNLTKRYTDKIEAYNLYLRARFHWNKRTEEGFELTIQYLQEAIEKDPLYALAYSGIADTYNVLGWYSHLSPYEAFPKAKDAALKALEIDDNLAEAHASLAAYYLWHDWDWQYAEREFKRSIELNPGYATAHHWYADCLTIMERSDEAIAEMKRAHELDPLSLIINTDIAKEYLYARKYDQALEYCKKTLELDPDFYRVYKYLGQAYVQTSQLDEAISVFQNAVDISRGHPGIFAWLGYVYALAARNSEAQKMLEELENRQSHQYVSPIYFAFVHIGLGENERAFEYLEKAYSERSPWLLYIHRSPIYDSLRSDSKYSALLRRMKLEYPELKP